MNKEDFQAIIDYVARTLSESRVSREEVHDVFAQVHLKGCSVEVEGDDVIIFVGHRKKG